jgi:hypothetical protein
VAFRGWPVWVAVVVALAAGAIAGLANGVAVAYVRIPSFVATLAIGSIAAAVELAITKTSIFEDIPPSYLDIALTRLMAQGHLVISVYGETAPESILEEVGSELLAVARGDDPKPLEPQVHLDEADDVGLVVGDEDRVGHGIQCQPPFLPQSSPLVPRRSGQMPRCTCRRRRRRRGRAAHHCHRHFPPLG